MAAETKSAEAKPAEATDLTPSEDTKRSSRMKAVEAEQKRYTSIAEFCNYYGLRYTSVQYYLRKGKSGDEILDILQNSSISRRYNKAPGRAVCVKIGDDVFQSASEAAMAYGVSVHQIEAAMEDGTVTPAIFGEEVGENSDQLPRKRIKCVIAGIPYPSRAAAARAYGIPMVTVRSRMAREGISFEEALRRGHIERHRIVAEHTKWSAENLEPYKGDIEKKKLTDDILSLLEQNNYHTKIFQNTETKTFAILIQEALDVLSRPLDLYVLYDEHDLAKNIEFVFPNIGKQRFLSDAKQVLLYQQINEVNARYVGSKISLRDRIFSASWSITHTSRSLQATTFMRSLYRFIGSTAGIWEELRWAEQETVPKEA